MGLSTELAKVAGRNLSPEALRALVRRGVEAERLALCLHRVRPLADTLPEMSLPAEKLDEIIEQLRDAGPASLTVTFDDGYADAAEYLIARAERWADVKFIFFVCPRRVEAREAFTWDEGSVELATVEQCLALARTKNVRLGNHTNSHAWLAKLSDDELRAELVQSREDFDRLFGAAVDFAIPFGTPGRAYGPRELLRLRALGYSSVWSTDPRPMREGDDALPRFALDGRWSVREMLAWIAMRSAKTRLLSLAA